MFIEPLYVNTLVQATPVLSPKILNRKSELYTPKYTILGVHRKIQVAYRELFNIKLS